MARTHKETTQLDMQLKAIETGFVMHELGYFMVEYNLPARPLANLLGISVQTIYLYADSGGEQRPSLEIEEKVERLVRRLKTLAAEGKLDMEGSLSERSSELTNLLVVVESAQ